MDGSLLIRVKESEQEKEGVAGRGSETAVFFFYHLVAYCWVTAASLA